MHGIIKDAAYQPLPHGPTLITHDSFFDRWSVGVLKGETLVVEENEIEG